MSVDVFDFGGVYKASAEGCFFTQAPDAGTFQVNYLNAIGNGDYEVVFQWSHYITSAEDPTFTYVGFTGHWVLEGVVHTVPVPAAAWLMGSGLIGLAGIARRKKKV